MIIINADDWGRSRPETDSALACFKQGRITSVTAMVFMADSERAAGAAVAAGLDVGLHLNLDEHFTGLGVPAEVRRQHESIVRYLSHSRYFSYLYNPFLGSKLTFAYKNQLEEFHRLYGKAPTHIDGHRHMHLCANMLWGRIIPRGLKVRQTFTFWPGEKWILNRAYRSLVNRWLRRQYRATDYFFSLGRCLQGGQIAQVAALARNAEVELMAHPAMVEEHAFLMSESFLEMFRDVPKGSYVKLPASRSKAENRGRLSPVRHGKAAGTAPRC